MRVAKHPEPPTANTVAALTAGTFAAIDFETATSERASACAMGVVLFEDGRPSDHRSWLIKPPGNRYDTFHTSLHGIGPGDTAAAPDFADAFGEACLFIDGRIVLAHYAAFDAGVIRSEHARLRALCPELRIGCTVVLARRTWPGLTSYSLRPLCAFLRLTPSMRHDAAEDALACGRVALNVLAATSADGIEGAAQTLRIAIGVLQPYSSCHAWSSGGGAKAWDLVQPRPSDIDPDHPFADADVAFTGALMSMRRRDAAQLVVSAGGRYSQSVNRQTEFLVFGQQDFWKFADGEKSGKTHRAEKLTAQGYPLQVIGEDDFLRMLG